MKKSLTLSLLWFAFLLFSVEQGVHALVDGPLDPSNQRDTWSFYPAEDVK